MQTFKPEHYVIQAAARHDYDGFAENELVYRKELGYPPFSKLVRLEYRHMGNEQAENEAQRMARYLRCRSSSRGCAPPS